MLKVNAMVPTGVVMNPSTRRPGARRAAVILGVVAALLVAPGGALAQDVDEETSAVGEVITPVTVPDGTPDPAAQEALDDTLALEPEAPPSPDDVFLAPIEAREEVEAAAEVLDDATGRAQETRFAAGVARKQAEDAALAEALVLAERDRRAEHLAEQRRLLGKLSVDAFVNGGDMAIRGQQAMFTGDTTDPEAKEMIMFEHVIDHQNDVTEKAIADHAAAEVLLEETVAASDAADRRSEEAAGVAQRAEGERVDAETAHREATEGFEAAVRRLRSAPRGQDVPQEIALIGVPRLDAEDLAGWFESSPFRSRIATPIDDIAAWFIEEGRAEGIRGDVAFAQAVLETGGFSNTDSVNLNNYSGIGHYDNLSSGWAFPSPQLGVRAQIQLLKSYAVGEPHYARPLVDRRLRGPAGCCRSWGDLTRKWATDPTYGSKVMLIYGLLVDHALARRAAGEGLEPL